MFWGWISDPVKKGLMYQNVSSSAGNFAAPQQTAQMLSDESTPYNVDYTAVLIQRGFSEQEIGSLYKLQNWYQSGGSDRATILYHLEFLRRLLASGMLEH